jgi:hypothetical protein
LIEFEVVKQFVQLPVLASFVKLHIMLLQAMECELGLIINKYFKRLSEKTSAPTPHEEIMDHTHVRHELFASCSNIFRQRSAEHHDLLVVGRCTENFLDVAAHV